jgi:hypothetical protein
MNMKIKSIIGLILGAVIVATGECASPSASKFRESGAGRANANNQSFSSENVARASRLWSILIVSGRRLSDMNNSYEDYADVLKTYVSNQGLVNYKELKTNREQLDRFVHTLDQLNPPVYEKWTEAEKLAFWINAYNALVLKSIIDHYPIKPSFLKSVVFPKNSIWHIPDAFDGRRFMVMGRQMSLDDIEHGTIRKQFNEPRIHLALVCAAMSCPPLRNEPFFGERLDQQLDDQTRRFLANPKKFRIDRRRGHVHLSSILKWYGDDFIRTYGTEDKFKGQNRKHRAVLNFISRYLDPRDRDYLASAKYRVSYLDYDWSLNEQSGR